MGRVEAMPLCKRLVGKSRRGDEPAGTPALLHPPLPPKPHPSPSARYARGSASHAEGVPARPRDLTAESRRGEGRMAPRPRRASRRSRLHGRAGAVAGRSVSNDLVVVEVDVMEQLTQSALISSDAPGFTATSRWVCHIHRSEFRHPRRLR